MQGTTCNRIVYKSVCMLNVALLLYMTISNANEYCNKRNEERVVGSPVAFVGTSNLHSTMQDSWYILYSKYI